MESDFDKSFKRATYRVPYIKEQGLLILNNKKHHEDEFKRDEQHLKLSATEKQIIFKYTNAYIRNVSFDKCSFYHIGKTEIISRLTFQDCNFNFCFLGSVIFGNTRFINCVFTRTDFENTIFNSCTFNNCTFTNCSATNTEFNNTEINPHALMCGIPFPHYNSEGMTSIQIAALKKEWLEIRFNTATSLFRSNTSVAHSQYSDSGLYYLKATELKCQYDSLDFKRVFRDLLLFLSCIGSSVNLFATKGGVSIIRIIASAMVIIFISNFFVKYFTTICYNDIPLHFTAQDNAFASISEYFEAIPYLVSLFLGFGFTNFQAPTYSDKCTLIVVASIGILWYALLIPVLIRKVYR